MIEYKRLMLLTYLKSYLLKYEIRMKWIMNNMVRKLEKCEPITHTQLDSVMSWIEREDPFRSWSRERIKSYFDELTKYKNLEKDVIYDDQPTLEPFFS